MSRFPLVITTLFAFACGSDYDISAKAGDNEEAEEEDEIIGDSADPIIEDTGDDVPVDTGTTAPTKDDPVADCQVSPNPVTPPFEDATWDGTGSYDPEGGTISDYAWTLVSTPAGSAVSMPGGAGPIRSGFMPDNAGTYTGQLIVTTTDGRVSAPCQVDLEAIPAEDLWIEMFWTQPQDDMDLHLIAPGGTYNDSLLNTDCYYANCTASSWFRPDWGSTGVSTDDPTLDLDDIPGTGPENINIPAPASGTYKVAVHDYTGSTPDYQGANSVTVNIYMNGSMVWTDTRDISGDGSVEYFALIDWSRGTVSSL